MIDRDDSFGIAHISHWNCLILLAYSYLIFLSKELFMTTELIPNRDKNASNINIKILVQISYKDLAGWFNCEVELEIISIIPPSHKITRRLISQLLLSTLQIDACSWGSSSDTPQAPGSLLVLFTHDNYNHNISLPLWKDSISKTQSQNSQCRVHDGVRVRTTVCQRLDNKLDKGLAKEHWLD